MDEDARNIFHLNPNREFVYSYPCHSRHLTEDMEIEPIYGIFYTYNAIGHILKRYNTNSTKAVFMKDIGDYYALGILESCWLLISQGKIEKL